jgi:hypothetical protein
MKKFLWIVVLVLVASCGKGDGGSKGSSGSGGGVTMDKPTNQTTPGQQAIPDAGFSEYERTAAASIRPFFDANATISSIDVKPGSPFDVWIVAEFKDPFTMAGAEYKLVLPEGISMLSSMQSDSVIVTMGKHEVDYMIAFSCIKAPKEWLMRYTCKADEDFKGGVIETARGDNLNFLGFVMCDVSKTEIRATGGTAEVHVK